MATVPQFAATPRVAAGIVPATLDLSLTAPANITTVFTAGANGSKIEEIVAEGLGTTVAGMLNIFLFDGVTYHLYDQIPITAATASATVAAFRLVRTYNTLLLQNGWSLRVAQMIAGNQSMVKVIATGGDF